MDPTTTTTATSMHTTTATEATTTKTSPKNGTAFPLLADPETILTNTVALS